MFTMYISKIKRNTIIYTLTKCLLMGIYRYILIMDKWKRENIQNQNDITKGRRMNEKTEKNDI